MPATQKTDLRQITQTEYEKFAKLLRKVPPQITLIKDKEDTSIKDIVAHRAHWIDLFLGWHRDGLAGKPVYFPAPGYKWNALKRYNAALREQQREVSWPMALAQLEQSYERLIVFIDALSDDALYGGPMQGAQSKWTTGRWAEAAGASHFRSASKYLRAALRTERPGS